MTKKRIALYVLGAIILLFGAAAAWMLGPALLPPKPIEAGIEVGSKAPIEMELQDSNGEPTSLAGQMGENGIILVLVRSADWCPFCKAQLVRTQDVHAAITGKGYALASLSYDPPEILAGFAAQEEITYAMLSDPGSQMIDALGLRDPQYAEGSFAYGVPRATILILANDGTVKGKYVAADYRSRPSNEDVLEMLDNAAG